MLYSNYIKFFKDYVTMTLPKFVTNITVKRNQLYITVPYKYLRQFSLFLRDHSFSLCKILVDIACVDYISRSNRFEINYVFLSLLYYSRITVKIYCTESSVVGSLTALYSNAGWYEREV